MYRSSYLYVVVVRWPPDQQSVSVRFADYDYWGLWHAAHSTRVRALRGMLAQSSRTDQRLYHPSASLYTSENVLLLVGSPERWPRNARNPAAIAQKAQNKNSALFFFLLDSAGVLNSINTCPKFGSTIRILI